MTIEDDIAFLERVPALRLLGRDALRILAIGAENRYIHEGISLFGEGEDADGAYVVQEGSFDLVAEKSGVAPASPDPGTLIGEIALLTETKRPVDGDRARAVERGAHSAPAVSEDARGLSGRGAAHARRGRGTREPDGGRIHPRARRAGGAAPARK